jgi:hypothetical protein
MLAAALAGAGTMVLSCSSAQTASSAQTLLLLGEQRQPTQQQQRFGVLSGLSNRVR